MERCDTEEAVFQIKFPTKNNDQSKSKFGQTANFFCC